jgi:hypothetical protein
MLCDDIIDARLCEKRKRQIVGKINGIEPDPASKSSIIPVHYFSRKTTKQN